MGSIKVLLFVLVASAVHGASTANDIEERKAQALNKINTRIQELTDVVIEQCSSGADTVTGLAQIVNSTQDSTATYIKAVVEALEISVNQAVTGLSQAIKQNSDETKAQIEQMSAAIKVLTKSLKNGGGGGGGGRTSSNDVLPQVIKCQKPFRNYNGQCLYINKTEDTWHNARNNCIAIEGDLAENEDLDALINFVNLEGLVSTSYWIGASDLGSPRNFHWVSGNPVTSGWRTDQVEPDYEHPGHDCVYIRDKGIGDLTCLHSFGYLCASNGCNER